MQSHADQIVQALKEKRLRVTPQRFAVYANLLDRTDHPTAEQILGDLNRDAPMSSQATVYSSLQALYKAGLVREVLLEEGVRRYDANVAPHHHFRCETCGTIEDIAWDEIRDLSVGGVDRYEVTVYGQCERCAATLAAQGLPHKPDLSQT
ncbi:MAG: transcriptional repressor [Oscillatoriales cyanobacterium]|nr:MAG: transcriptional repressor [Oscillatoriales cyanobacterium]